MALCILDVFQSRQEFKKWFSNPVGGMIEGTQGVQRGHYTQVTQGRLGYQQVISDKISFRIENNNGALIFTEYGIVYTPCFPNPSGIQGVDLKPS